MYGKIDNNDDSVSSAYTILLLLAALAAVTYAIARFAESNNRLNYENRFARIIAGLLLVMTRMMHTKSGDLEITNAEKESKLIAVGPHRTGWEAVVLASKMKGTPPRFLATTAFDAMPGVSSFLKMFKAIPVDANSTKSDGRSANAGALEQASKALNEQGCVALFPQGNFARLGEEPPRVYAGAAKLALMNKIPIHVVRLDGFWSLQNPIIPVFVRNSTYYRAFFSAFHMNNVRATLCSVIDFHLQPENEELSEEKKIEEICAQLYAYYRHTQELTPEQISTIKTEISNKTHLLIWNNKVKRDELGKQLLSLKKEGAKLEEPTVASMSLS
ncbi:lysophospholipid acyltransferase family protein [Legionella anisa]|uniref:1-acyl-sn-glycerol-3-phosphate acyltransferase n=1 Tax=Legionella anisa TaxID=28082 RepID=A0AAX0WPB9_9GAMM|nr:lysophospholipid acyltransferase family protein [Legionella anisa]AWN73249.1 1-acyl-sn-glycerol-3-phosphate acyltransferase [Legionella anisa]KTC67071.1 Acyltransferase [Legionella anisa]MCW8424093.1 1-acyl-sn-glycerol-3-phosphate acyltransferase [Legionella anisa]MCW8447616.1 1-acyl-sn-glycerol-3-phosphate acyltransferase [Legionella anisa]PNL60366.1 1-acyl-sn-glycerol-3-phosphate acyltransferase [Legionella anisa]